jgi:hypothetical protein
MIYCGNKSLSIICTTPLTAFLSKAVEMAAGPLNGVPPGGNVPNPVTFIDVTVKPLAANTDCTITPG